MTVALIATNPFAIVATYGAIPNPLRPPNGDPVSGAQVGWSGQGYALVSVAPFVPPTGQQITGAPSYAIDGGGNVTQSYATVPIPPPTISVSSFAFRQLFTTAEALAITTAAQSSALIRAWLDDIGASGQVNLGSQLITTGLTRLVTAGLLTQARALAIAAGTPPS